MHHRNKNLRNTYIQQHAKLALQETKMCR